MKKPLLIIDRDGTLIDEPLPSRQIDAYEKLAFLPMAIPVLHNIAQARDFRFIMLTNQDGLGTDSFPEDTFWPVHNLMMDCLKSQGVEFEEVYIDRSFEHENKPTRKPGIALIEHYLKDETVDMPNSYVIGDRHSDVQLAENLGCKSIRISEEETDPKATHQVKSWEEIEQILLFQDRQAEVVRKTKETDITVRVNLDGQGQGDIATGLHFFDHMLDQIAKHGKIDLYIRCKGDLEVDEHHTMEDTALALGEAILKALGNKKGIERYGFLLPMDESLAQVAIDFSGRNWLVWEADFKREKVGDVPTEMFSHFFKSFSDAAKCTLHISVKGDNEHHKIEGIFKAFAKSLMMAFRRDLSRITVLPSTKGSL